MRIINAGVHIFAPTGAAIERQVDTQGQRWKMNEEPAD